MQLLKSHGDFHLLNLGGLDFVEHISFGVLQQKMELEATRRLRCQERIQLKNGERGEVAWR